MRNTISFLILFVAMTMAQPSHAFWNFRTSKKVKVPTFKIAIIRIAGRYPDRSTAFKLFGHSKTYANLVRRIYRAKRDPKVKAVLFHFGGMMVGTAKANEIRKLIMVLRQSGKKTYALLDAASMAGYLAATSCDKIFMVPSGMLYLPGLRSEMLYFKKMLDKIGVVGDFVTIGNFKTAPEPFLRETMSEGQKKQMTSLLNDLYEQFIQIIAKQRKIKPSNVKKAIDLGLLTPSTALKYKLIDKISYITNLHKWIATQVKERPLRFVKKYARKSEKKPTSLWSMLSMLWGSKKRRLNSKIPKIAVIYAEGQIQYGSKPAGFNKSGIWSNDFVRMLDKVKHLKNLKAIVLRVNSPGGSALASDLIWKKLEELKKKVPLFVSMGNVAASGGYYISMGADLLFAEPTTITGSIGVFGGKVVWKNTLNKLGINVQTISRGKHSGIFSTFKLFSPSERLVLKKMLEQVYKDFVTKGAQGRKMTYQKLLKLAGGRVWTGKQAKTHKLVDLLGGLLDALKAAKKRTGLLGKRVQLVNFPRKKGFFEALKGLSSAQQPPLPYGYSFLFKALLKTHPHIYRSLMPLLQTKPQTLMWSPIPNITLH